MTKKILFAIAASLFLTACSHQGSATQPTGGPATQNQTAETTILIEGFTVSPKVTNAKAGQTITFTNKDIAGHSITSDTGEFDTGVVGQNQSATFTAPTAPGTYLFHCTPHPDITGTLIVE